MVLNIISVNNGIETRVYPYIRFFKLENFGAAPFVCIMYAWACLRVEKTYICTHLASFAPFVLVSKS
jgi:hypothetical protein